MRGRRFAFFLRWTRRGRSQEDEKQKNKNKKKKTSGRNRHVQHGMVRTSQSLVTALSWSWIIWRKSMKFGFNANSTRRQWQICKCAPPELRRWPPRSDWPEADRAVVAETKRRPSATPRPRRRKTLPPGGGVCSPAPSAGRRCSRWRAGSPPTWTLCGCAACAEPTPSTWTGTAGSPRSRVTSPMTSRTTGRGFCVRHAAPSHRPLGLMRTELSPFFLLLAPGDCFACKFFQLWKKKKVDGGRCTSGLIRTKRQFTADGERETKNCEKCQRLARASSDWKLAAHDRRFYRPRRGSTVVAPPTSPGGRPMAFVVTPHNITPPPAPSSGHIGHILCIAMQLITDGFNCVHIGDVRWSRDVPFHQIKAANHRRPGVDLAADGRCKSGQGCGAH